MKLYFGRLQPDRNVTAAVQYAPNVDVAFALDIAIESPRFQRPKLWCGNGGLVRAHRPVGIGFVLAVIEQLAPQRFAERLRLPDVLVGRGAGRWVGDRLFVLLFDAAHIGTAVDRVAVRTKLQVTYQLRSTTRSIGRSFRSSICSSTDPLESARETLHSDDAVLRRHDDQRLLLGDVAEMFATRSARMQRGVRQNARAGFSSSDSKGFLRRTASFAVNPGRGDTATTRLATLMIKAAAISSGVCRAHR